VCMTCMIWQASPKDERYLLTMGKGMLKSVSVFNDWKHRNLRKERKNYRRYNINGSRKCGQRDIIWWEYHRASFMSAIYRVSYYWRMRDSSTVRGDSHRSFGSSRASSHFGSGRSFACRSCVVYGYVSSVISRGTFSWRSLSWLWFIQ
jgi:hypothetical protein